jgi:hypothetical protein
MRVIESIARFIRIQLDAGVPSRKTRVRLSVRRLSSTGLTVLTLIILAFQSYVLLRQTDISQKLAATEDFQTQIMDNTLKAGTEPYVDFWIAELLAHNSEATNLVISNAGAYEIINISVSKETVWVFGPPYDKLHPVKGLLPFSQFAERGSQGYILWGPHEKLGARDSKRIPIGRIAQEALQLLQQHRQLYALI